MRALRHLAFLLTLTVPFQVRGQLLKGTISLSVAQPGQWLLLYRTSGTDQFRTDSARIGRKGEFQFAQRRYPVGFYRLGIGNDMVELVLNPTERVVNVRFAEAPLREGIQVIESLENQRLWEYKRASRHAHEQAKQIEEQRRLIDPLDSRALDQLTASEQEVTNTLRRTLDHLVSQDEDSYFSRVIRTDSDLLAATVNGPKAVRDAMKWSDASLTRSAVYPRAVMALLQSATPADPPTLRIAADSVLSWASSDTACWAFVRYQLIEVFATYGPEEVAQHLVDRYVVGPGSLVRPDARLRALVAEQMKNSIGVASPDVVLPSPDSGLAISLHDEVRSHSYTALFFYSSTCDHCHIQMGPLNQIYMEFTSKGLQVIGVAIDEDVEEFRANIKERKLRFPCYSELVAWGSPAARAFGVRATPTIILLDREGRIAAKPYDAKELDEVLRVLLP